MKITNSIARLNELFDSDPRNDTEIANSLGVSKQSVSSWRSGERSPKKPMLIKIAETYDVSLEWLMGFDVDRKPPNERMIVIKDAELFNKALLYMDRADYDKVIDAYEKALKRMKDQGVIE